tara:strand:+ start:297 stop:1865 length:1569 start_codon:yes stop_codon:yes gene_type:complete
MKIFNHRFFYIIFLTPSLVVGWLGLNRPYYFRTDQDLLWVLQSMRIYQGLPPTYGDHPGAYWPFSYLIKIYLLSSNKLSSFFDQNGAGSLDLIKQIIYISRVENAIFTAAIGCIFYLFLRELDIQKKIAFISSYCLSLSSAILYMVSDIRHESIGIFFMLLYLLFNIKLLVNKNSNIVLSLFNIIIFYISIFCKQQILLIYPLIFLCNIYILKIKNFQYYKNLLQIIERKNFYILFLALILSGLPWILISTEEINKFGIPFLINFPFWCFLNAGLIIGTICVLKEKINFNNFIKYNFILLFLQFFIFEILSPNIWRRAITSFPSYLFLFSSVLNEKLNLFNRYYDLISYIRISFDSILWPSSLGILFFTLIVIFLIQRFYYFIKNKKNLLLLDYSLFFTLILICIFSLRPQPFYQIYYLIPILVLISLALNSKSPISYDKKNHLDYLSNRFLFLISITLLVSLTIKSTGNLFNFNEFVTSRQNESLLCDPQTIDFTMRNTIIGNCENFEKESINKIRFDSWH